MDKNHAALSLIIPVSFFRQVTDNFPYSITDPPPSTWWDFLRILGTSAQIDYEDKHSAYLFSPTIFNGTRSTANATTSALLVIDSDDNSNINYSEVLSLLQNEQIESFIHTTASNQDGDSFRVIVPLETAIDMPTQHKAVKALVEFLAQGINKPWQVDSGKRNAYSLFYLPGRYKSAGQNECEYIQGSVLSADELLEAFPQPDEIRPQPIVRTDIDLSKNVEWDYQKTDSWQHYMSLSDGRYDELYGLMKRLAMSAISYGYDLSLSELCDIIEHAQSVNCPSVHRRDSNDIRTECQRALNDAPSCVTESRKFESNDIDWSRFKGIDKNWRGTPEEQAEQELREELLQEIPEQEPEPIKTSKRFFSAADCRNVKSPEWDIKGLIPSSSDVAIYGVSGTLKSFLALDLTLSLCTALQALGHLDVKKSKASFYFAGEGFHNIIKRRRVAWEVYNDIEPYSIDNLWFVDGAPVTNDAKQMESDIEEMKTLLNGRELGFVVIDTLSRALNGMDEDKASTASNYFARLKQMREALGSGLTTITVGHFGKDTDRGERGSSAFRAGYDTVIWIENHTKDDATGMHTLQALVAKQKDGDDGKRIWLQSQLVNLPDEDGESALASLVLVPIDEDKGKQALKTKETIQAIKEAHLADEVEEALIFLSPGGGSISNSKLVNYMVEKEHGDRLSRTELTKFRNNQHNKLKRYKETVLAKFVYKDGWGLSDDEPENFTSDINNDLID